MKRKICIVLFIALALLNVYDIFSTNTLLTSGQGFYEVNPAMRFLMDKFGLLNALIVVKAALLVWIFSFILRARTERMWNILTVGLIMTTSYYTAGMYFLNYQSMLSLVGGV